jgi:hypothetical protein
MRHAYSLAIVVLALSAPAAAQTLDKELVATLSGPALDRAIVSELLWDEGMLIIQSAALRPDGQLIPRYFAAPGPNMELRQLQAAPPAADRNWNMKASRISPTGLGKITNRMDSKMPMVGVGRLQDRMLNAVEMGGMDTTHELRLGRLTLHTRKGLEPPYDGEVWAWSAPELNRIAYVDSNGNLWIARADGASADRVMRGRFTLPAWSDDGRLIAVAERKDDGTRWDISIVRVPERFRK